MHNRFTIKSDHHSLKYLSTQENIQTGRLGRWLDYLADFEFEIQYVPGKNNASADALSRLGNVNNISINESQVAAKEEYNAGYEADVEFQAIYDILKNDLPVPTTINSYIKKFKLENELLYYSATLSATEPWRLCVPNNEVRKRILHNAHYSPTSGHAGYERTYMRLMETSYWRLMPRTIKKMVGKCHICQTTKHSTQTTAGLLMPLPIPERAWEQISLDLITGLTTTSAGFDAIMVVVNRLTKMAHFIPTTKTVTGPGCADLFLREIVRLHGIPRVVVSDRDPRFMDSFWKTLHRTMGVKLNFSTRNHPESDGQTERVNKEVGRMLRAYCSQYAMYWDRFLHMNEFAYNSQYQGSIKCTPFFANHGYEPNQPSGCV